MAAPFTLPPRDHFVGKMRDLGISTQDKVVCYSQKAVFGAYRMWYLLTRFGHPNAFILDGNLDEWRRLGFPYTFDNDPRKKPEPSSAVFDYHDGILHAECYLDDVISAVKSREVQIIDARDPEGFGAKPSPPRRLGHIPGAISLYSASLLGENGKVMEEGQLRALLSQKSILLCPNSG